MVTAPCSTSYSYDVCGPSGTIAAVTKTRCLLISVAAITRFLTDVCQSLKKFCVLLHKRGVDCYKSLKECVGTLASSYDAVR
jgi:hypothetical protein